MRAFKLLLIVLIFTQCTGKESPSIYIGDDGVKIGNQIWMKRNLDVKAFRNGDPIMEAKSNEEWLKAYEGKVPAWSYYDNLSENGDQYGILYNYYSVIDTRGLAPEGWRIPNSNDWEELVTSLGGYPGLPEKLRSETLWKSGGGSNSSGFNAYPAGIRNQLGFLGLGEVTTFWANSLEPGGNPEIADINGFDFPGEYSFSNTDISLFSGFSVRCIFE
jgi:uncharacterized protein (TIGR02145 family)